MLPVKSERVEETLHTVRAQDDDNYCQGEEEVFDGSEKDVAKEVPRFAEYVSENQGVENLLSQKSLKILLSKVGSALETVPKA